ncbi:hypothetical protein [Natronosalvus rutilus]|uniref:Uncharacterized protein n=1 Tax=Natronosalvus rutilus TaxID=2953753 RepID=A0A9E7SYF3_9EURY|nr:hypothetical protein [Natronosalvus rutilus]UTF55976.1 hypothetical protein NGM29_21015 [Natronosalvus rutilus]
MSPELTEGKKLKWLGAKRDGDDESEVKAEINRLERTVGGFDQYQIFVDESADLADHEFRLIREQGWPEPDAELFTSKIDNSFDDWWAYDNYINVQVDSYRAMKGDFPSEVVFGGIETTGDGEVAVGVRLHDEAGVSKAGLSLPPGTIELFGSRLEISEMKEPDPEEEDLAYGAVEVEPAEPIVDEEFEVFCPITNNSDTDVRVFPQLVVNGVVEEQVEVDIAQGATEEARFSYVQPRISRLEVQIDGEPPVEVRVTSGDL